MAVNVLACPACKNEISSRPIEKQRPGVCMACGCEQLVQVFPAALEKNRPPSDDPVVEQEANCCFYHEQRHAAEVCSHCGKLICSLCSIEAQQQCYCPVCLDAAVQAGHLSGYKVYFQRHDALALMVACLPLILAVPLVVLSIVLPWAEVSAMLVGMAFALGAMISLITSPMSLYLVLHHYKTQRYLIPALRWRFWLAGALACAGLLFWGSMVIMFISTLFF